MPALTDGQIRNALKRVAKQQKMETLTDGEGRGVGRLTLVMKPMPTRVTADWFAQQYRDGKRTKAKIGSYPALGLAEARELFNRDFAITIQKGASIKVAGDTRPGTVADLFEAYCDHLEAAGKRSHKEARKGLNKIADTLGRNRLARDITPDDIVSILRPIYERGARSMADHTRSYLRSAYSWAMRSEHDYRSTSPRRFRLSSNPAAGIPTEPKNPGQRWLREEEWVQLWRWLGNPDTPVHPPYCRAIRLLMTCGQRVEEIASLHVSQYDPAEKMINFQKTKNGKAHSIPLPALAVELIEGIKPNEHGWLFPSMMDPSKPVTHSTLYSFLWRQRDRGVVPMVTNRDMRRTFFTLAGAAGVSKEIRSRICNHTQTDVSSVHYDRYHMLPEKRHGMALWDAYMRKILNLPPLLEVVSENDVTIQSVGEM